MITPREELEKKNDEYINNLLQNKSKYSVEEVQIATLIYEERGLADPKKQELIKQYPDLRIETLQKYENGMPVDDLMQDLLNEGVSVQDAQEMVKKSIQKGNTKIADVEKTSGKNKFAIGLLILVILIIIIVYLKYK